MAQEIRKTRARRLSVLSAVFFLFTACTPDIHQLLVTADNQQRVETAVMNNASFSATDKAEFQKALNRWNYHPHGKTVEQILTDQRDYDVTQKRAAARSLTRILGSWRCSGGLFAPSHHFVITFNSNHIETISTATPQGEYSVPFDFDGFSLDEKGKPEFQSWVALSGGVLRITRIAASNQYGELETMPHRDISTCRRASRGT
jgi:hypothetical protein